MSVRGPIVLVGLPGAGKSKVGRLLAGHLGIDHIDTDALIVERDGRPIADIFATDGEAAFRVMETEAVAEALTHEAVVSLGGGAVETPEVREALRGHTVVHLDVDHAELLRRVSKRSHRPLLRDDPDGALRQLRERREPLYREVESLRVHGDDGPPERLVDRILARLGGVHRVRVDAEHPYDVTVGRGLASLVARAGADADRAMLIHTESVAGYAHAVADALREVGVDVHEFPIRDAEAGKTLTEVARAWDAAGALRLGRRDLVVGVGGGAVTDMAGFVAATWLRGVRVIQVPTTVLGMVDAAVGGKTGINTDAGKNLVGAFHEPVAVVEDLDALASLDPAIVREGLGEVVKCGFIRDPEILRTVMARPTSATDTGSPEMVDLILRSVRVKADVVGADLREGGLREILNYGHTLAHAIEKCESYSWRHGEAVAVGCVFAAELAHHFGMLGEGDVAAHREAFSAVGLPTSYSGAPLPKLLDAMLSDKKVRAGRLRFVLLDGLQNPVVREVEPDDLRIVAPKVGIDVQ